MKKCYTFFISSKVIFCLSFILISNLFFSQRITSFSVLDTNAGLVCYPILGQYFTYSKVESDGFWDVYTRKLDGTNKFCWTCNSALTRSNAHPEWHPTMKYIIFQGEKITNTKYTHPGFGWYYDLWALDITNNTYHLLRDAQAANPTSSLTGVLHPHFSHDGSKLVWAELHGSFLNWQDYSIMIADYVALPTPHLENVIDLYNPIYGLVEPHGFSFNDDKLLYAGNNDFQQSSVALDLFYLELNPDFTLKSNVPVAVSKSNAEWAEAAKFTPDDQKVIFSTTKGYPIYTDSASTAFKWRKSEYWISNANGTNPKQLSYFMHPDSLEFMGLKADGADFDISPNGNELIATVNADDILYVVKIGLTNSVSTGIDSKEENTLMIRQSQNYIYIDVAADYEGSGRLAIYDCQGKLTDVIADNIQSSAFNTLLYPTNKLVSGIYFLVFTTGNHNAYKKIMLMNNR